MGFDLIVITLDQFGSRGERLAMVNLKNVTTAARHQMIRSHPWETFFAEKKARQPAGTRTGCGNTPYTGTTASSLVNTDFY